MSVLVAHAQVPLPWFSGLAPWAAVNAFYVVSGFYMALVLNEKYAVPADNLTFYINRFLRLYPAFLVGLALAIGFNLIWAHDWTRGVLPTLSPIGKAYFLFSNFTMFGLDITRVWCFPANSHGCVYPDLINLNVPSWTISVEIAFYCIAPFILRSLHRVIIFTLLGAVYLAGVEMLVSYGIIPSGSARPGGHELRYFSPLAAMVFFGLGAMAYHVRTAKNVAPLNYVLALLAVFVMMQSGTYLPWWAAVLLAGAAPILFDLTRNNRLDRAIGELSYPVYILHYPILLGLLATYGNGVWTTVAVVVITLILSAIVYYVIDRPVDQWRSAIASRGIRAQQSVTLAALRVSSSHRFRP